MDLKEIGWKGVDWIHLTQDKQWPRVNSNKPTGSIKYREFLN
jgi:hypothetical protein